MNQQLRVSSHTLQMFIQRLQMPVSVMVGVFVLVCCVFYRILDTRLILTNASFFFLLLTRIDLLFNIITKNCMISCIIIITVYYEIIKTKKYV